MEIVGGNLYRMRRGRWSYSPPAADFESVLLAEGELIFVTETPKLSPHGDYLVTALRDSKILTFWAGGSEDLELVE